MKIVSSGKVLNSREFYDKKTRKRRSQFLFLSIGFIAIIALLIYLSRQERFLISEVVVLPENVIDKEELAQMVQHSLDGYYLWIIPRAGFLIYPRRDIERNILKTFPRLNSVDINLSEEQKLFINVQERAPFALYCINTPISQDASECFFLDKEGFIFAPAPSFSSGVYFVYITQNLLENPIGKRFMTNAEFKSLSKFITTLVALDIQPLVLKIGESDYYLTLSSGGQIIWRRDSDLILTRSNLEAFLSDDSIRTQKNFFDKILYLDLRTENKVFYKFRE